MLVSNRKTLFWVWWTNMMVFNYFASDFLWRPTYPYNTDLTYQATVLVVSVITYRYLQLSNIVSWQSDVRNLILLR